MPRIANLKFSTSYIAQFGLEVSLLADILDELPDGTNLICVWDDLSGTNYMMFESDSFLDSPIPTFSNYPEIEVTFFKDANGEVFIKSVDLSKVLDPNKFGTAANPPLNGAGLALNPSGTYSHSYSSSYSSNSSLPSDVINAPDQPKPTIKPCHHTYVKYHGLSETFDYCSQCGVRK